MITIEPIARLNVLLFKEVRLRALEDSPGAFGSTYAKESQFADSEWMQRVERWNGETGTGFLAMAAGVACGIAGVGDHGETYVFERSPDVVLIRRYPRQGNGSTKRPCRWQMAQKSRPEERPGVAAANPTRRSFCRSRDRREP
jgi:hypothetical protein